MKSGKQFKKNIFPTKSIGLMSNGAFGGESSPAANLLDGSAPIRRIQTLVIFDLETTGLDVNKERITEMGALSIDFDYFCNLSSRFNDQWNNNSADPPPVPRVMSKICLPVNPGIPVNNAAAKCSGLNNELLNKSGNFKSAFDTFYHFLNRLQPPICLVAHNGNRFDFKILKNEIIRNRLDLSVDYPLFSNIQTYDTMFGFKRLDCLIWQASKSAIEGQDALTLDKNCNNEIVITEEKIVLVQGIPHDSANNIDYVRERNPDLYKRLVEGTADFYRAGNSLAAVAQHFFGVNLNKGFQGRELAWAKRPLPSDALEYAALDVIAHFDGKSLRTPSTESIKRTREEKSSTKSSKSPPKRSKVGAEINPTQASSSRRVIEESQTPVEIAFGTPTVFKSKPPPPDCHFSAFNYFRRRFDTPLNNREAIDSRAQAKREANRHLDDNLAAFIICFMPPIPRKCRPLPENSSNCAASI
uniref:Exonuclease domain-containing protein n=1 Tax=Romanomermis culicivorax TaxID=13658 RepID=A0A915HZ44_ROMCU